MKSKSLFDTATIALLSAWLGVFVLLPGLLILGTSLLSRDETRFVDLALSAESYRRLIDPLYAAVFARSAALALAATALCLAVGYPFAYLVARAPHRLRPILLVLVVIPFWTNSLVRTYAIRTLLAAQGLFNGLLQALGVIDEPLRLLYTETAVISGLVYVLLPFMVLPLFAVIEQLDQRMIEAAEDLGANRVQVFARVVIPLTLPGIIAGSLLVFLPALGMFYVADLLGGAKDLLIGNLIKSQFLDARDWPFGSAASVTMTAAMALLLGVYGWSSRRLGRGRA